MNKQIDDQAYREAYNEGSPIVPDYVYDNMFGTDETSLDETSAKGTLVPHLHPMLSLPTYFYDIPSLTLNELYAAGLSKSSGYVVSFKEDGVSVSAIVQGHTYKRLVSRGKRTSGFIIHEAFISIMPKLLKPCEEETDIRGELVISIEDFEKINKNLPEESKYSSPRSMVSAQVSTDNPDQMIISRMKFHAHGIWRNGVTDHMHMISLMQYFANDDIVPFCFCSEVSLIEQTKLFYDAAMVSSIPCDGIVIQHAVTYDQTNRVNLDRIAIKQLDEAKYSGETTVTNIEWRLANNGSYFPRLHFKPVDINGSTVTHAAGYCYDYLVRMGLSIDAKVLLTMRGGVIPYVSKVMTIGNGAILMPRDAEEPMPGDIQLWSTNSEDAVQRLRFIRGLGMLDLEDCGTESFNKLYDAGYKTLFDLTNVSFVDLVKRGFPETKTTMNLVKRIRDRFETFNYVWLILALRIPGIGFTSANIAGHLLSGYDVIPQRQTGRTAIANLLNDQDFVNKIKATASPVALEHADLIEKPKDNRTVVCMSKRPTNGMTKNDFAAKYLTDYVVTGNINEASILICPAGESSNKINNAKAKGITIKTYEDFIK